MKCATPGTAVSQIQDRVPKLRWLAAATLLWAGSGWSMDLLQVYQTALQEDATVRAARAAADAGRERVPQARAQLLPSLSLNASRNHNDLHRSQASQSGQPLSTDEKYFSYSQTLQLRQPLFRKPLWAGLEQANYLVQDTEATLERELQNLGVRVVGFYLEALLAHDQLDLVLKQKALTETQLDVAKKALVAGSGTRTDIDEAQARLDLNRAQELEARQHLDYTRRQLEVLTRQPVGELARLDAVQLMLEPSLQRSLEEWLDVAQSNSPELLGLQYRADAARLEVSKAQGGHYPTLDAVAQVTRSASETVTTTSTRYINRTVGLQLNVPIFTGGYTNSVVRQALAEQLRAEETLEAAKRDLGLRLHREYRGVTEGVAKVKAFEQAVRSSEQLVKSVRRSFEAGSRTMVDILDAEQKLQSTRRDLAEARYLYLSSWVRLHVLAGQFQESTVSQINQWFQKP